MKIWLRRVLALAFISLGIALVFLPFNTTRSGSVEQEVVYLQKENLLDPLQISTQFPGEEINEVSGPEFNPDDYPSLWLIFNNLDKEWPTDTCEISEWNKFQEIVLQEKKDFRLVVFHETLINCAVKTKVGNSKIVTFSYFGRFNANIKELQSSDLKNYPGIIKAIENISFGKESVAELSPIPIAEWNKMVGHYLNPMEDAQTFKFDGTFYGPEFGWDFENIEGEIPNLSIILKIIGALLFLFGLFLLRKLYSRKRGIMVNPQKVAMLYDFIVLLLAVPSAWLVASLLLEKLLFIPPVYTDDEIFFMGVFFFCFGIPFISLFTSRFTSQSVQFNSIGILVDSLSEKNLIKWESLRSIEFSNEYVLVGRVGTIIPKKLQKSLKFIDANNNLVILNEPQLKSVKKKVIADFKKFAPTHISEKFLSVLNDW